MAGEDARATPGLSLDFRRLEPDDLPLLHEWLNDPAVVRWWEGRDVSWDAVVRDHTGDTAPFEHWLALDAGEPVGWSRCYRASEFPDETYHWREHLELSRVGGIDYLVGTGARGRGLGTAMLRGFVDLVVFGRHADWQQAAAGPFAANHASVRALANAGFRRIATLDDEDGPCALMVRERG